MVKNVFRILPVVALTLVLTAAMTMPDKAGAAVSAKKPKATNVQYFKEDGKKTGIKTFTIDTYTYYNMSKNKDLNPSQQSTMKLDDAALLRIAKKQIFPKWGLIAEEVFRDQANQLVTIEGKGMMSSRDSSKKTDFDRHFSTGKVSNGYTYKWAVKDLAEYLSKETSLQNGDTCWDETRVTGITKIGSLNDARTLMGQELRNCSDDNDVSKDEFLGNNHQKNEDARRLPDLEDDKTGDGFANVVTCVNRAGASGDYDYVTFGLAVYDFDITPVAAENLKYIEAADDSEDGKDILMGNAGDSVSRSGITFQNDTAEGTTSYLRNDTTQEVTQSSALENSSTEENSVSAEDTFEWGMEQEIGTEWSLGGFESEKCMFPRCTLNISNSWHELWSTTKSKSETKSTSKTKSVNTEVSLPGHTVAVVNQSLNNKKTTENYQQPVILSYKVAVYAMSGDYFNGAAGGIENNRYDKQWMSVLFDGSDDYQTSGCYALGSLYNRGVVNKDTQGYDGAKGKYKVWCDKGAWNKSSKINWGEISKSISGDSRSSHRIELGAGGKATTINDLATELPLMEKAQMLTSRREAITSSVDQIVPLYPLASVSMENGAKNYELRKHATTEEKLHLDEIELKGYDSNKGSSAEFYEFDPSWGEWKMMYDNAGEKTIINDGDARDEDPAEGRVKSGGLTLVTDDTTDSQWVETDNRESAAIETYYLKWKLKEDAKIVSNENLTSEDKPQMTEDEKDAVDTPAVKVTVRDENVDVRNIETEGTYKTSLGKGKFNLAHIFGADAVDESGKARKVAMFWEAKSLSGSGIEVSENGDTEVTKKGTYKVRPYCYDSNDVKIYPKDKDNDPIWLEVIVQDRAELSEIKIEKPDFDEDEVTLTKKKPAQSYDLESFLKYYDQYGEKWEGTEERPLPKVAFTVDDTDGAEIDMANILTVTRPGTYTISARAKDDDGSDTGINIKPVKITVGEEDWLDQIVLSEPALDRNDLKLNSSDDVVKVENLKGLLTYIDQNNDEWTGKKPNVTFTIKGAPDGAEIKGGSFYAYAPGTYTINASAEGFRIDPVQIVVEERQELVLESNDPGKQYLYHEGDTAGVELGRCINATTKFGGKYKGNVPDLVFSMDPGVKNAKITKKTIFEDEDDYVGRDVYEFSSSVPGEYVVHVKPKKASTYASDIDDIYINVVKGKKVCGIRFREINTDDNDEEMSVNNYIGYYPEIDLEDYIEYYDGYEEKIDPKKDHVKIPDCKFTLELEDGRSPYNGEIVDNVLKAKEPDYYVVKATTTLDADADDQEDKTAEAMVNVIVYDIDWLHDFGDWVTEREATCDENGLRVKKCRDEGCDYEITDTIPSTGHRWKDSYERLTDRDGTFKYVGVKCDECGAVNEDTVTPYSKYYSTLFNPVYEDGHEATCTEPGVLIFKQKPSSGVGWVDRKVNVPAIGHKWNTDFTDKEDPDRISCQEEGEQVIKCERCDAERKGKGYTRVIPKEQHDLDENGWEYYSDGDKEYKESCEDFGIKIQSCKKCNEEQYDILLPLGHDWDEGKVTSESACAQHGTKEYKCKRDPSHTRTEFLPVLGHTWKEATYEWAGDNSKVIAQRICDRDPAHKETETVNTSATVVKKATYTEKGKTKYTAKFKNSAFKAQTKTVTDIPVLKKKANTVNVKAKNKTIKRKTLKKKAKTFKLITVKNAKGNVTYKIAGADKKSKKALTLNKKNGKIKVKKKAKKGTYKIKVTVTAAGTKEYKAGSKTVTVKIKVN